MTQSHFAASTFEPVGCRIASDFAGGRIAFGNPETEYPRLRAGGADLQIEAAAIAIHTGALFARDFQRSEFSGDRHSLRPTVRQTRT